MLVIPAQFPKGTSGKFKRDHGRALFQRGRNRSERGFEIGPETLDYRDNHERDSRCDEPVLDSGRPGFVFQEGLNTPDHARNIGRSFERSVNPYRKTADNPCDRMAEFTKKARPKPRLEESPAL
jgi:hypothetical protein